MNTTLPTMSGQQLHPPTVVVAPSRAMPRVSWLDRLAMRAGLALLMWGRRRAVIDRQRAVNRHLARLARQERERDRQVRQRDAERAYWLLVPPR